MKGGNPPKRSALWVCKWKPVNYDPAASDEAVLRQTSIAILSCSVSFITIKGAEKGGRPH